MKTITATPEIFELLYENGILTICSEDMEVMISDEDAIKAEQIIMTKAPAAIQDYSIE